MPRQFGKNVFEGKLSAHLLRWLDERIPKDDPIRVSSIDRYQNIESLGSGRFGEVCKYMNSKTMIYETVKKVNMDMFDHWTQDVTKLSNRLDTFISEFRYLHKVSNNNSKIVNFIGIFNDSKNFYIMSEYLHRGSVKDKVMKEPVTEDNAIKYLKETLEALDYLHSLSPPVIHRDIKAANLLITISDSIKLGNFGLVRDLAVDGFGIAVASEITLDFRGTLLYVAPEVLSSELGPGNRKAYDLPADIWALGCTFVEILVKYPPHFEFFGHVNEANKVLLGYAQNKSGKDLPYTSEVLVPTSSLTVQRIIDTILIKNPAERPNTKKLQVLIQNILDKKDEETDDEDDSLLASTSTGENENDILSPLPRKFGRACSSNFLNTTENGTKVSRQKTEKNEANSDQLQQCFLFFGYYFTRILYFLKILFKSVCHLLLFLVLGLGALILFLLLSYFIVQLFRYFIRIYCECDLMDLQHLIISGILLVLLFALLFSCCMVALGEYKFRMANRTLRESKFFISRPENSVKLFGVKILPGKESTRRVANTIEEIEEANTNRKPTIRNHDDYYYDTP